MTFSLSAIALAGPIDSIQRQVRTDICKFLLIIQHCSVLA